MVFTIVPKVYDRLRFLSEKIILSDHSSIFLKKTGFQRSVLFVLGFFHFPKHSNNVLALIKPQDCKI